MEDVAGGAAGACCLAVVGGFQQLFNTKQWGMDWKCCDSCCRCTCCWDEGEFDPNDRPGASAAQELQSHQEGGPKRNTGVERIPEDGEEGLPSYKASEQMSIPAAEAAAATTTPVAMTGVRQSGV